MGIEWEPLVGKLLDDSLVVSFETINGSAEDYPIDVVGGLVSPDVFVLQICSVLLGGVQVAQMLCNVASDYVLRYS